MRSRHLLTLDAPTRAGEVAPFLRAISAALDGSGPAVLPLPPGPEAIRTALVEAAQVDEPLEDDDIALVVATSGSTGTPKLAMLTADALLASARATQQVVGGPSGWGLALPLSSIGGLQMLVRSLDSDTRPVFVDLTDGFTPAAFNAAATHLLAAPGDHLRATSLVPTQLFRLLDDETAVGLLVRLDAVLLGGAAAHPSLVERARDRGMRVITTYGMTETSGGCVYDGLPLRGVGVRTDPDGHIVLSGRTLFTGYRLQPQRTAEVLRNDELITHDLGRIDATGRLVVLGRDDDVVISGGVNVSCLRVESVLIDHPQVEQVVVVGVDDAQWGQRVVAAVVPTRAGPGPSIEQLREFAAGRLPPAALPRAVVSLQGFPLLTSGKPDRTAVRTLASGSATSDSN